MKHRFSVEMEMHPSIKQDEAQDLLIQILTRGCRAFGHTDQSLPMVVEKLRARSIDPDKPVEQQE